MKNERGFTLIELLLVVMIIGFMLAIIVPRGLRATTDAKYNLVRQNAAELASFANDWIEQQILAQDEISTATRADYLDTLAHYSDADPAGSGRDGGGRLRGFWRARRGRRLALVRFQHAARERRGAGPGSWTSRASFPEG